MPAPATRRATPDDIPVLVALMREFYAESDFPLPEEAAAEAFAGLLADERLGRLWLIEHLGEPAGYVALTVGYSMEYGGLRGFVYDLFVRAAHRGRGLAAASLAEVAAECEELEVRALLVEVGPENDVARRVYARAGLEDTGRVVMARALAPPTHERAD